MRDSHDSSTDPFNDLWDDLERGDDCGTWSALIVVLALLVTCVGLLAVVDSYVLK